mgnify:CR=1 FL=1
MAEALIAGLIWLLIWALFVAVICYVVTRLIAQFLPGAAGIGWIFWAIGGLVLLLLAFRLFGPLLPRMP